MAETPRLGDLVTDTENVLQTVFIVTDTENVLQTGFIIADTENVL